MIRLFLLLASLALARPALVEVRLNVTVSRLDGDMPIGFDRRSYNGGAVGPTIRVRRGDTLRLVLDNQLSTAPPTLVGRYFWDKQAKGANKTGQWAHDQDVYSHPNYTNIHLHGMHVSPAGTADDITRTCAPQSSLTYEYTIPADHSAGTFWYHPHFDQASALQIASGMVGALIVEDDAATLDPALAAMAEQLLVLHEVSHSNAPLGSENILCFFCEDDFSWPSGDALPLRKVFNPRYGFDKTCGKLGAPPGTKDDAGQQLQPFDCSFLLLNGAYQPALPLVAGQWTRWRVVQSSHQSALRLAPPPAGCEMVLLALDGAYLDAPRALLPAAAGAAGGGLVLPAGARADVAVRCAAAGSYNVSSLGGGLHARGSTLETYEPVLYPRRIATLLVAPAPAGVPAAAPLLAGAGGVVGGVTLPRRPAAMADLRGATVDARFRVVYNLTGPGEAGGLGQFKNGGMFSINDLSFRGRPEHCMELGSIQEWTIVNAHNPLERWMHSFHIHVNNFQVVSNTVGAPGQLIAESAAGADWRDTIVVPVGGQVTIRMNLTDFVGVFPFHCHVTAHQDLGMMMFVEIVNGSCGGRK